MDLHRPVALLLLAIAGVAGCYAHRLPAGASDGGTVIDTLVRDGDTPPTDAESPPIDAALMCPLARADFTCFSSEDVVPGRPFTLPLSFDTLVCCGDAACAVAVDAATRTLHLTSALCPDTCECRPTRTPVAECAIPALAEGVWLVEVNGAAAFQLPVGTYVTDRCIEFAEVDSCTSPATIVAASMQSVSSACVHTSVDGDRNWIDVTDDCGTCDREGPCIINVFSTPDGAVGNIDMHAYRFRSACAPDCPAVCIPHTRRCELPPLHVGGYYEGPLPGLAFVVGTDTELCVSASGG